MGQTSDPETLVIHQTMTPGNNPEDFKQQSNFCIIIESHLLGNMRMCFLFCVAGKFA
jgi:hypothetical protein